MSGVTQHEVLHEDDGMRLDRWFRHHYPALAHGQLQKLLRTGQVRVDGGRAKANARLIEGQIVRIPPFPPTNRPPKQEQQSLDQNEIGFVRDLVLYQDDNVIAVNKPHGLAVQGGTGTVHHLDRLLDGLRQGDGERPRLVHRLDRDTSGVLLLARTRASAQELSRILKSQKAKKVYWALVSGVPKPEKGRIDIPLVKSGSPKDERMHLAEKGEAGAKNAVTEYEVLDYAGQKFCWLAMMPLTGRTHQLRVHAAAIGHPVIGDSKYGGQQALPEGDIDRKLHLHARQITIPRKGVSTLSVMAPLPDHMRKSWSLLGFDENTRA